MSKLMQLAIRGSDEQAAKLLPAIERVRSVRVDDEGSDAVVVFSFEDAYDTAEQGKHVFLAAPCLASEEQAKTLLQRCQSKSVTLFAGGLPRNSPACAPMLARLTDGKLGEPGLLRVHRWWDRLPAFHNSSTDRLEPFLTFGDIDLAIRVFGEAPTEVFALERGDPAYLQIHLGFSNGGMALLDFAKLRTGRGYDSVSLIGSTGAAYADAHHNVHLLFTGGEPKTWMSDPGNGFAAELSAFANCVLENQTPAVDGAAILRVHRVIEAVRAALETPDVLHMQGSNYERV